MQIHLHGVAAGAAGLLLEAGSIPWHVTVPVRGAEHLLSDATVERVRAVESGRNSGMGRRFGPYHRVFYSVYTEQNQLDRGVKRDLNLKIFVPYKHLIWIAIWMILVQILDRLRCNNDWTMNNLLDFDSDSNPSRNPGHDSDRDPVNFCSV